MGIILLNIGFYVFPLLIMDFFWKQLIYYFASLRCSTNGNIHGKTYFENIISISVWFKYSFQMKLKCQKRPTQTYKIQNQFWKL